MCHQHNAKLLIDDSAENALACARDARPRISVLLFGNYSWNQRISLVEKPEDHLGYEERLKFENGREWWKDEHADDLLPSDKVTRVKDWNEVIEHVRQLMADGAL